MIASDFPVSFPYGATTPPYTPTHPHRGDDRACPMGTPVVINGVTIGLTGATGQVTGPHLHIQEWQGNVVTGTRKPQNAFKGGTVVNIDPTQTQGDGSFGKFITVRTADGWNDSYCHLSSINVTIGQVLEGNNMVKPSKQQVADIYLGHNLDINGNPTPATQQDMDYYSTQDISVLYEVLLNHETANVHALVAQNTAGATVLKPGLYKVQYAN